MNEIKQPDRGLLSYLSIVSQLGHRPKVIIYTDGSSHPKLEPHSGGWAFMIMTDGGDQFVRKIIHTSYGGELHTTNNRMELTAIIKSVECLPHDCDATIITDSQYCIGVLSGGWSAKDNTDLISSFRSIVSSKRLHVSFKWVKGHADDKYNNYVDKLTNAGSAGAELYAQMNALQDELNSL